MQIDEMTLLESQLILKGNIYQYSDVIHIGWKLTKTINTAVFIPIHSSSEAVLSIFALNSSEPLVVYVCKKKLIQTLFNMYINLSKKTFITRLKLYFDKLNSNHYFDYSHYSFFETGDIFILKNNQFICNINECNIVHSDNPYRLFIEKQSKGFIKWFKSMLSSYVVDFDIDRDIFQFLLFNMFHKSILNSEWNEFILNFYINMASNKVTAKQKYCPICTKLFIHDSIKCSNCGSYII